MAFERTGTRVHGGRLAPLSRCGRAAGARAVVLARGYTQASVFDALCIDGQFVIHGY
jgi:hypothetical protein